MPSLLKSVLLGDFTLDVAFQVPARGIATLFGSSGCGKTTILRCAAGLRHLKARLCIGEETWQDAAAGVFRRSHQRPIGYVFQEASLFPHLCVRDNLLYGVRRAIKQGVYAGLAFDGIVELLGIGSCSIGRPTRFRAASASGWRWDARYYPRSLSLEAAVLS